jgi:hypothetical protein
MEIPIGTTSFGILYQLRDIYSICRCSRNVATYKWKVHNEKIEIISTSKVLRSPSWLGWPLWNICVTNDHGYVPLVVSTSRFFPHAWLITGFVTRVTQISYQLREIYSICRCYWNVATYEWKVHDGKIEIISFIVKFRSLPSFTVYLEVYVKVWSRAICICGILYFKLKGINAIKQDFLDRGLLLTGKLLKQRFLLVKLKSSRRKFCGRHHDKNPLWNVCVTDDNGYVLFVACTTNRTYPLSSVIQTFHTTNRTYPLASVTQKQCNTTNVTSEARTACPSWTSEFTTVF